MIAKVTIRNWQSLKKLDLPLGRFTVIVGASSSGKTALMRAFRALASNVRGTDAITRGATKALIAAELSDRDGNSRTITLEHVRGAWIYHLSDPALPGGGDTYTKLAGSVPDDITRLLNIDPVPTGGASLNFAGQFDPPYLLRDSGAAVARTLGELTNVNLIFEAVREAVRRRNAAASVLRTREQDLAGLRTQLATFTGLPARLRAVDAAEVAHARAARLGEEITALRQHLATLDTAQARLNVAVPEVPDLNPVLTAQTRLNDLTAAITVYRHTVLARQHADNALTLVTQEEMAAHGELHTALAAAGHCPTCGQPVPASR